MAILGHQLLSEFHGCDRDTLSDPGRIERLMRDAAWVSGATIPRSVFHRFNSCAVSGVVVIAESHMAIHTRPEHCYAAIDLFTCGKGVDPWRTHERLKKGLRAQSMSTTELCRGRIIEERDRVENNALFRKTQERDP